MQIRPECILFVHGACHVYLSIGLGLPYRNRPIMAAQAETAGLTQGGLLLQVVQGSAVVGRVGLHRQSLAPEGRTRVLHSRMWRMTEEARIQVPFDRGVAAHRQIMV